MGSFFKKFVEGENPVNWTVVISSIVLGYIAWLHNPNDTISIHYFVMVIILSMLLISKLAFFAFSLHVKNSLLLQKNEELIHMSLPKIISLQEYKKHKIIVSTKSALFTVGLVVTIVYRHEDSGGYEEPLCIGKIGHIQNDTNIMQIYLYIDELYSQNEKRIKLIFESNSSIENLKIYLGQIEED